MQKTVAIAALVLLSGLSACSKKDASPAGLGVDGGTSGPSNFWLNTTFTSGGAHYTQTEIRLNTDHSVAKIISISYPNSDTSGMAGDTTYTVTIPVYSGGRLVQLQSPTDSNTASGPATTIFDYSSSGALQRIRYNPGTNSYAYDSLVLGAGGMLALSYHFILDSTTGIVSNQYWDTFTWNSQKDVTQVLVSNITNGSVSDVTVAYTYDGFYNPYKTVRDLPFMLGPLDNIVPLFSAHNTMTNQLVGYNSETTYAYQYNPSSLPVSQNIGYLVSGSIKQSTFVYFQYIQ